MKKNILFLIAVFMLSIVATPVAAQSRKDKKAAKKAEWEMEQQRKKEEAELMHQMHMDSLRAVKEGKEYQREKEYRLEAEREAERQAEKREQEYLRSQEANYAPCYEADTEEYFTGHQQRFMPLSYVSTQATSLLRSAQQQLRQKIKGAYKQVVRDYFDQLDIDDKFTAASHIESAGEMIIDEFINNTQETCRKQTRPDASGKVTLYIGIKVSKEEIVREIVEKIPQKVKEEVRLNEEEFRNETFEHFKKVSNE